MAWGHQAQFRVVQYKGRAAAKASLRFSQNQLQRELQVPLLLGGRAGACKGRFPMEAAPFAARRHPRTGTHPVKSELVGLTSEERSRNVINVKKKKGVSLGCSGQRRSDRTRRSEEGCSWIFLTFMQLRMGQSHKCAWQRRG